MLYGLLRSTTRMPALKYANQAILFSNRLILPLTVSADWCGPKRPPLSQILPTGTCHTEMGNGLDSVLMSSMYVPARTLSAHGFMSPAPASSTLYASFLGNALFPILGTMTYTNS